METERTSPDSANSAEQDQSGEFAAESAPGIDSQNKKPSHTRINLACLKCRSRRARCSGERPTCASCARTASICVWPDGRKRKRTRAEMLEAEKQQKLESETHCAGGQAQPAKPRTAHNALPSDPIPSANALTPAPPFQQPLLFGTSPAAGHSLQFGSTPPTAFPDFSTYNPLANDMFVWAPQFNPYDQAAAPLPTISQPHPLSAGLGQPPISQQHREDHTGMNAPSSASSLHHHSESTHQDAPQQSHSQERSAQVSQEELFKALGSQKVFIDGDPDNSETIDLFYYRMAGSTAIHPGINRINLRLHKAHTTSPYSQSAVTPVDDKEILKGGNAASQPMIPSPHQDLQPHMFDDSGMPLPAIYEPLLDLFFKRASAFFPSVSQKRMAQRLETGTMSAFMLNAICAISARFTHKIKDPTSAATPFLAKAQELLIPLLHLPAHDVVTGLLLLTWAAYGSNSEAGCWQFAGIAFRMAIDMGLHENQEIYESKAHLVRTRLLFWSLFITDRVLSFAYGRPSSISEEIIEIPLPSDADLFPDPARTLSKEATEEPVEAVPFTMLTKLMVQVGRISNVLNGRRGRKRTLVNANEPPPRLLAELQNQLVELYTNMPSSLRWSVDAFKHHESRGHGGLFLTLHLWANAVLTLTYHPELMTNPSGMETPVRSSLQRSVQLSLASARLTTECLVYADLCSSNSYICAPLVVQPIYVAALAFLHEVQLDSFQGAGTEIPRDPTSHLQALAGQAAQSHFNSNGGNTEAFLATLHKQSLTTLSRALQRIEHYWAGAAYATNILSQRQSGLNYFRIDPTLRSKRAAISLPDHGLLRRFQTSNPTVNPATETSLRDSMAAEQFTEFPLEDLFPSFEVQQTFITPATSFDVAQLLGTSESM